MKTERNALALLALLLSLSLASSALAEGVGSPVIPPHTHEGGTATCTEAAICVRCGQPYGEPLGHLENITPRISTCTEPGLTEGVVCARCGEVLKAQEETPALGHDWGEWKGDTYDNGTKLLRQERVCQRDETHVDWQEVALGNGEKLSVGTKVKTGNATYVVTKSGLTLTSFDPGSAASITVPSFVRINGVTYYITEIGSNAFEKCGNVTEIILGKNIKKISAGAFTGCKKLNNLILYLINTTIDKDAFKGVPSKTLRNLKAQMSKQLTSSEYMRIVGQLIKAGMANKNFSKSLP